MLLASLPSGAIDFSDLDAGSADAGASRALAVYYAATPDAGQKIYALLQPLITAQEEGIVVTAGEGESMNTEEVRYETPVTGVVCVPGALNIRSSMTALSDVVAQVFRSYEILIYGESIQNGHLWYHVGVYEGLDLKEGYVYADYIKIGEEADAYFAALHEQEKNAASMPQHAEISEYDTATDEQKAEVRELFRQINYSLENDYNPNPEESSFMNRYAVLSYIVELYQQARGLTEEYNMNETLAQINVELYNVILMRENLVDESGGNEEELQQQILEAQAERKEKQVLTLGESIAEYAATFVGSLPYIWGGASLSRGADCSGFAAQIYAHFGLLDQGAANVHAYDSTALRSVGHAVTLAEILPGDLVCYNGHVAIYYGGGLCVNEPAPGRRCSFDSLYMLPIVCVRRLQ